MNQNSLAVHLRNRGSRDLSYRNPRHTPLDNRYRLYIPVELLSMWSFWQFYCPSILWILASYIQLLKNLRRSIVSTDCNRKSFLYYKILDGIQTQNIYLPFATTKCDITMAITIAISSTRSRNIFTISARRKSIIRLMRT